jgi:hypothetical protein
MLKNKVINEGAQTGLYMLGGARGWKGHQREMTAGVHYSRVRSSANAWEGARMGGAGRGRLGLGVDASRCRRMQALTLVY